MLGPDLSCTVVEEKLTDGSTVYTAVLTSPDGVFRFNAVTQADADKFAEKLADLINAHCTEECITF